METVQHVTCVLHRRPDLRRQRGWGRLPEVSSLSDEWLDLPEPRPRDAVPREILASHQ